MNPTFETDNNTISEIQKLDILTSVMSKDYRFENVKNDEEFIQLKFDKNNTKIFDTYVLPRITKLIKMAPNNTKSYHVMIPIGWKNAFEQAKNIYKHIEKLMENLRVVGNQKGYDTTVRYSTMYHYYGKLKDMGLKYPTFTNDFDSKDKIVVKNKSKKIPAVGSYSQDINFKSKMRKLYNSIMAMKVLFVTRLMRATNNELSMSGKKFRHNLGLCRTHIISATQLYVALLNHDSISGIHTEKAKSVQNYNLDKSMKSLSECREIIYNIIGVKVNTTVSLWFGNVVDELSSLEEDGKNITTKTEVYKYTIVNPTGYKRTSQVSVTVPNMGPEFEYIFILQHKNRSNILSVNASIIELETLNVTNRIISNSTYKKAYMKLDFDALADRQLLMILTNNKTA